MFIIWPNKIIQHIKGELVSFDNSVSWKSVVIDVCIESNMDSQWWVWESNPSRDYLVSDITTVRTHPNNTAGVKNAT